MESLEISSLFLTPLSFHIKISEFQVLRIYWSRISKDFIIVQPRLSFTAKNHSHAFSPKSINISCLVDNINLCLVHSMNKFLKKCSDMTLSRNLNWSIFGWMKIRKIFSKYNLFSRLKCLHQKYKYTFYSRCGSFYFQIERFKFIENIPFNELEF